MSRALPLLALLSLSGCWVKTSDYWNQASFDREYDIAYCDWVYRCFGNGSGWTSKDDCVEDQSASEQDLSACAYDDESARKCVNAWLILSCNAWDTQEFPEVCDQVYDCSDDTDTE